VPGTRCHAVVSLLDDLESFRELTVHSRTAIATEVSSTLVNGESLGSLTAVGSAPDGGWAAYRIGPEYTRTRAWPARQGT
jgi:hypothetical protein